MAAIEAKLRRTAASRALDDAPQHNPELVELYQRSGLAKADAVLQYVETLMGDNGQKLLLFAHHTAVLDKLEVSPLTVRALASPASPALRQSASICQSAT